MVEKLDHSASNDLDPESLLPFTRDFRPCGGGSGSQVTFLSPTPWPQHAGVPALGSYSTSVGLFRKSCEALADVAQLVGVLSHNQKVAG